jgi:hypothetical protein
MKDNNYTFIEEIENEITLLNDDYLEVVYLDFKGVIGNTITICYNKKDKTLLGVINQIASLNTVFSENELENKFFKVLDENEEGKVWSKSSYNN